MSLSELWYKHSRTRNLRRRRLPLPAYMADDRQGIPLNLFIHYADHIF